MILNIKSWEKVYKKLEDIKTSLKTLEDFEMDKILWGAYAWINNINSVNSIKLSDISDNLISKSEKKEVKKVFLDYVNTYISKKVSITKIKEYINKTSIPYKMIIELLRISSWEYTKQGKYILLQKEWDKKSKVFKQQSITKYDWVETKMGYDYVLFKELDTWEIVVLSKS